MQWQRQRGLYLGIAGNGAKHRRQHVRIARHPDHNRAPRTQVVEVIDRGPFSNGANWDLTQATAESLGMSASDTVGAVALR